MNKQPQFLWQYVEKWASEKPDAEAIVFGKTRMTWAQVADAVDRTARAFLELGVEKGDCIALVAPPCPEFIISFMAAAKISAIWVGLSPRFSIGEMGRILRDCRPAVLITKDRAENTNLIERALTFSFELSCIREILVIGKPANGSRSFQEFIADERDHLDTALQQRIAQASPEEEVLLMYTSGSSGLPKGVLHSHKSILSNVRQQQKLFEMTGESRILLHFPINHVAADVEIGYCAVYVGACLVIMDGFDAAKTLDIIAKEHITVIGQVPAMYLLEMREPAFEKTDWSSVKTFVWGGSTATQNMLETLAAISKETGARLVTGYGATELGGFVTATGVDDSPLEMRENVGAPYSNCKIRIVDEDHEPVRSGTVGEVAVRGPVLMKGYLNSPALTSEVMDGDGWYYTSDLGSMDKDGILSLHGRCSEMFKTGGENVFPCEIENVLESHPAVLYAAVIVVPDEVFSEVCHAHIMAVPGIQLSEQELTEWCKEQLAPFKVPKKILFHATLPLLPSGKVDKLKLKEQAQQ